MGTWVHFSRSLPSNSWWQTMAGWQVLSRPSAAEGGGRRPAFTGLATRPYSATEVDGWQHKLSRVSQNRAAVHGCGTTDRARRAAWTPEHGRRGRLEWPPAIGQGKSRQVRQTNRADGPGKSRHGQLHLGGTTPVKLSTSGSGDRPRFDRGARGEGCPTAPGAQATCRCAERPGRGGHVFHERVAGPAGTICTSTRPPQ
jgi:hypothetical protein